MRIDYCPKCHKAGLKYLTPDGRDSSGKTREQRFDDLREYCKTGKATEYKSSYGNMKWCSRCKEWVNPENRPYVSSKGVG